MTTRNPEFQTFKLNARGHAKADEVTEAFDALLTKLCKDVASSRELSIAKTKLEEACFFARKAVARDPANHDEG